MPGAEAGLTRLVVCDTHDGSWVERAASVASPGDRWDVLVLGVSAVRYRRRFAADLGKLADVRVLDNGGWGAAAHEAVREYVLRLVYGLPATDLRGVTLGELLRAPEGNLWWSLVISEKSSFRGLLIERLFRLALIDRAITEAAYAEVWLRVSDAGLSAAAGRGDGMPPVTVLTRPVPITIRQRLGQTFVLAYWLRAVAAAANALLIRAMARVCGWRVQAPGRGGLALFTLYPYWWLHPYDEAAADRFFSAPPSTRATYYLGWMTWPRRLWVNRTHVGRVLKQRQIVPLQCRLGILDALTVLAPARFARLARVHARVGAIRARFLRFDVSAIVQGELRASLANAELMMDHLIACAIRAVVRQDAPSGIAYRCENQPWEAALVRAAGPERTIGFFHSPFGENYAALRFAAGDLSEGPPRGAGPRPAPGRMLVCGDAARDYLVADGYPEGNIAACGPQRHASFVRFVASRPERATLRGRLGLPTDVPVYFVAIAIIEIETEGLFACLEAALDASPRFHLVIKTHPNRPMGDDAMRRAMEVAGSGRTSIVPPAADMYEYLAASDAMITIGSTVAFEAMALGVMPVVYEHPATYAVTSLRAFESALFVVNSPESLRDALAAVAADSEAAQRRRAAWPLAVRQVFGDIETSLPAQMARALAQLGH